MPIFPPIPSWPAIHPLTVHFPIALLLIAPVFILIGMIHGQERSFPYLIAALILMILGTAGTYLAASSGEAAGESAQTLPYARSVLEQHEELAVTTELAFTALTLIFASILLVPRVFRIQPTRAISVGLPLVFLVFYATGAISLANTAHQGARLVHELGVRATMHADEMARHSGDAPARAEDESAEKE